MKMNSYCFYPKEYLFIQRTKNQNFSDEKILMFKNLKIINKVFSNKYVLQHK